MSHIPVIILAGGFGTRFAEETDHKPKPMITIGDKPILWHIIEIYRLNGLRKFIIATGYKNEIIDEWVDFETTSDLWKQSCDVRTLYTGMETQTAGRIKQSILSSSAQYYMATYGDGLGNINCKSLLAFHLKHKRLATITAVRPPARFGEIKHQNGLVTHFGEKSQTETGLINGGFFVLNSEVIKYIHSDSESFEYSTLPKLVADRQVMTYEHNGFWQPMDTLREQRNLEALCKNQIPPWFRFSV